MSDKDSAVKRCNLALPWPGAAFLATPLVSEADCVPRLLMELPRRRQRLPSDKLAGAIKVWT